MRNRGNPDRAKLKETTLVLRARELELPANSAPGGAALDKGGADFAGLQVLISALEEQMKSDISQNPEASTANEWVHKPGKCD